MCTYNLKRYQDTRNTLQKVVISVTLGTPRCSRYVQLLEFVNPLDKFYIILCKCFSFSLLTFFPLLGDELQVQETVSYPTQLAESLLYLSPSLSFVLADCHCLFTNGIDPFSTSSTFPQDHLDDAVKVSFWYLSALHFHNFSFYYSLHFPVNLHLFVITTLSLKLQNMFLGFDLKFSITSIWKTLGSFSIRCIFFLYLQAIFFCLIMCLTPTMGMLFRVLVVVPIGRCILLTNFLIQPGLGSFIVRLNLAALNSVLRSWLIV